MNAFKADEEIKLNVRKISSKVQLEQTKQLKALKQERDNREVLQRLREINEAAKQNRNTVLPILYAIKAYATTGEICDTLRDAWGEYEAPHLPIY